MDYFKLFGTKSCVFDDLCLFLDVYEKIDREAVLCFMDRIREMVESEPIDFDCSDDQLKVNVCHTMHVVRVGKGSPYY